jgi:phosphatidylinositol alpha-mannosyltransferase
VSPYDLAVPGGVGQHIHHLDGELRSMGHKSWILGPCSDESASLPANVIRVSQTVMPFPAGGSIVRLDASPATYPRVKGILDRHRFDIIHVHEPLVPMLPWAVLRHSRSVNIGTFHATRDTDDTHTAYAWGKPIIEPIFNRLHGLIAVSEPAREMVSQYYPGDYRIIPNGVDFKRFGRGDVAPIERFADGRPTVLFVGRLDKRKGFRHLLAAFGRVQAALPDARLLVVGGYRTQSADKYRDYVEEHDLRDVHFVGRVSDEELPRYYHTADVFCAPSTGFESFGIVLLEAMAAGTPVVASDISGYRTIVTHGAEGLLVPAESEGALAQALTGLLCDEPGRRRMGEAGRVTAQRYNWPRVAAQVAAYYEEVLVRARS